LIVRFGHPIPGLVLIRIDPAKRALRVARLAAAIAHYGEGLFGRYLVIEEGRFRARLLRNAWAPSR
jgi:hypothetical protein